MKAMISLFVVVLLISSGPHAEPLSRTYVGLFVDANRLAWCASGDPAYTVECWFWILPGTSGFKGLSCNMPLPPDITWVDGYNNPDLEYHKIKCNPPCPDFASVLMECQYDWVWIYRSIFYVTSSDPAVVELLSFPDNSSTIIIANCNGDDETIHQLTNLYINYASDEPECTVYASESKSWGSIKGIYNHRK